MKISYACIVIIAMTILVVQPISSETVTLRYFDIRGLAEPIRLALSYLNIDYEEVKYARCAPDCKDGLTDWTEAKKVGTEEKKKKANVTLAALLRIDLNYLVHRTFAY